jgi:hypothetical protein
MKNQIAATQQKKLDVLAAVSRSSVPGSKRFPKSSSFVMIIVTSNK